MTDDYETNANRFRPEDPAALALEARRLRDVHGLTPADVAHVLRCSEAEVRQWLWREVPQ